MTLGEKIKRHRKAKKLTQKQLAELLGVATGTIQQYELNKRQPRLETLDEIAQVLGVDVWDLYNHYKIPSDNDFYLNIIVDDRDRLKRELTDHAGKLSDEYLEILSDTAKVLYDIQEKRRKGRTYPLPKRSDQNSDIQDPEQ